MVGLAQRSEMVANTPGIECETTSVQLMTLLVEVGKRTRALLGIKLAQIGIMPGQDQLLLALSQETAVSVSVLADRLGIRPSTVSKMSTHLKERGLVISQGSEADQRITLLRLTPDGFAAQKLTRKVIDDLESELAREYNLETLAQTRTNLADVADILERKLRRLR